MNLKSEIFIINCQSGWLHHWSIIHLQRYSYIVLRLKKEKKSEGINKRTGETNKKATSWQPPAERVWTRPIMKEVDDVSSTEWECPSVWARFTLPSLWLDFTCAPPVWHRSMTQPYNGWALIQKPKVTRLEKSNLMSEFLRSISNTTLHIKSYFFIM